MRGGASSAQQSVHLVFLGDLPELLQRPHREGLLNYSFAGHPAVKDSIEACGVPHTEVNQIVIDGRGVDFSARPGHGERIVVAPWDCPAPATPVLYLCPPPPEPLRFILDVHLGTLARRLRLLGFDCLYRNDYTDREIIRLAVGEARVILTGDRGLLKHACVEQGMLIRDPHPQQQLLRVVRRYRLSGRFQLFRRCPICNGLLVQVDKDRIRQRLPPRTAQFHDAFRQCPGCGRVYWRGTHFKDIRRWISDLKAEGGSLAGK